MTSYEPLIALSSNEAHSIKSFKNKRSKLKGGDSSDIRIHGSDLNEQDFSSL